MSSITNSQKMKAMVLEDFNRPLVSKEVPIPELGPGEALVKILNCGVCGTDIKIFKGLMPAPVIRLPHIMGHEVSGEVVKVAPDVKDIEIGQRGVVYFYLSCGRCRLCQSGRENICINIKRCGFEVDGGYAQFQKIPARNFCPVYGIPPEETAILPDAIATSYHAIKTQGKVGVGDRVLIVGCGGLGIHAVQIAKLCEAEVAVVNINQTQIDRAGEFGKDIHLINSKKTDPGKYIRDWTKGEGVDVVIETVGISETLGWSLPSLRRGGRLVIVGYKPAHTFPLNIMSMHLNEWEIIGTRLCTKRELTEAIRLVEEHKITPIVDRIFPLEEANEALKTVEKGNIVGRVVLKNCV